MILAKNFGIALAAMLTFAVLAVVYATPARADGTFNVNTTTDINDGVCSTEVNGCSLRDAIADANDETGDVVINVPAGNHDLTLGFGLQIAIEGNLTINGAGARTTIVDGLDKTRVLNISFGTVTINQLTITGGINNTGAGLCNEGSADTTLNNVTVTDNHAGQQSEVPVPKKQSFGSCDGGTGGGGILNEGSMSINSSTVSNNTSIGPYFGGGVGGGIYSSGATEIVNSTISGNKALEGQIDIQGPNVSIDDPGVGGGIYNRPYCNQGGLVSETGGVDLQQVTVANNEAGYGGGIATEPCYFSEGDPPPQVFSSNTIVADNVANEPILTATGGADNCYGPEETFLSDGYNLETDISCQFTASGDQQNADPKLGPLQNNGGPTDTQALDDGSAALDSAGGPSVGTENAKAALPGKSAVVANSSCSVAQDQRGVTRPQGPGCDVGAYEKEIASTPSVTPQSGGAAAGAKAQAKPSARSSISGPRSCVNGSATVRVRGLNISSVTYSLNGKKIKTAKGNNTSVKIGASKIKRGKVTRVSARVSYTSATATAAQTKRISLSRCAKRAVKPQFTG